MGVMCYMHFFPSLVDSRGLVEPVLDGSLVIPDSGLLTAAESELLDMLLISFEEVKLDPFKVCP